MECGRCLVARSGNRPYSWTSRDGLEGLVFCDLIDGDVDDAQATSVPGILFGGWEGAKNRGCTSRNGLEGLVF